MCNFILRNCTNILLMVVFLSRVRTHASIVNRRLELGNLIVKKISTIL
ncbi:hypothetical protein Patl1_07075 [Pistacia atlantica]|uniref:Uncharacterized protein n=1 Tax=Pistacia atlantica TaxID=434234 RepID=A0ACC1AJJ6_9ROSI|nr:hypothetical protein Patl1_07075 [Pistacia atlantica]